MVGLALRLYTGDEFQEIPVAQGNQYSIGNAAEDNIHLPRNRGDFSLSIMVSSSGWTIQYPVQKRTKKPNIQQSELEFGKVFPVSQERKIAVSVFEYLEEHCETLDLKGREKITLGRSSTCDITIESRLISGKHVELTRHGEFWSFRDCNSANGTYLNQKKVESGQIRAGDSLAIGQCTLSFTSEGLYIQSATEFNINFEHGQGQTHKHRIESNQEPYPFQYEPSPRLRTDLPSGTIEIDGPPAIGGKPSISWANVLLMPIISVGILFAVCYFLAGTLQMLYYSVPFTLVGAIMAIVRYNGEKKKYRNREQLRISKYTDYLVSQAKHMEELSDQQRNTLLAENPSLSHCCRMARDTDRALWDRKFGDSDFMALRVGLGEISNRVSFKQPRQAFHLDRDELAEQPMMMAAKYEMIPDCPILVDLGGGKSCGIIGRPDLTTALGKNLVVQTAAHHSYEDVRIVVFCDAENRKEWEFCKWLPHVFSENRSIRYISDAPEQNSFLLEQFDSMFLRHGDEGSASVKTDGQWYLFVCASSDTSVNRAVSRYLSERQTTPIATALFLARDLSGLPQECHYIIEAGESGVLYGKNNASDRYSFRPDAIGQEEYEQFARCLAPLRVEPRQGSRSLPQMVTFLQGYKVRTPAELRLEQSWENVYPEQSMAVPIGIKSDGEPFFFDIHEKHCGPHGLVAGMTGSGKSEMIQSWILSMAVKFPPSAVSFVLVDFKGTGLLLPFKRLPHLAGMISDLDTSIGRNLIALENELRRRKALLDRHQVSNIASYLKLLHSGQADEPLSYLFIVIDEFAEFKARFPDFMQVVDSVFAIGRTLGVHMILLTQKPANVVDDKMNANTRFRWCLKVASSADSRDMLRRPDAAKIMNPGRAFVQVGEDEVFEEIQSYWSGAPYNPHQDPARQQASKVAVVDLYGRRAAYEPERTTGYRAEKSEIEAVVEYLDAYTQKHGIQRAAAIWTSKLPETLGLRDIMQFGFDGEKWNQANDNLQMALGLVDDPRSQSQYPFFLNLLEAGNTAVYGAPGTGKTTLLHTAIVSLAMIYPPDYVNMYLMDFGGGSLSLFEPLPHVGEIVVGSQNDEDALKVADMLQEELARRKAIISKTGLMNIGAYLASAEEPMPYIILFVDNFAPIIHLYPELDVFFQTLTRDGAGCGMYLFATANAQNAIGFRTAQNMSYSIALRMTDASDYAACVGRTGGLVPENFPGRGLCKGSPPLEFQTALPADGALETERVMAIRSLVKLMSGAWSGDGAPGVPVTPDTVKAADYPGNTVVLGVGCKTGTVYTLDTYGFSALLVSVDGHPHPAFQAIYRQAIERMSCSTILFYEGPPDVPGQHLSGPEFDEAISSLMPVLQERKVKRKGGPLSAEEFPFIVVVIDDLKACFEAISNDTVPLLRNVVTMGKGLNVILLVSGEAAEISKLYYCGDILTLSLVKNAASILLGGAASKHNAFSTNLPPMDAAVPLTDREGYLLLAGQTTKIKVVQQ